MHTRSSLANDFRALGVQAGDVVMLHASVRAVGEIAGGIDQIHLALRDALTPDGTLLMYAACPAYVDEVGRGGLTAEQELEVLEKLPAFDAKTARSDRSNGALVEMFRTWPDTLYCDHIARFIAAGKDAAFLVSHQPWDYAYGRNSVLDRFHALDGKILMLGSDHDTVTFLHHSEHVVDVPDKIVARFQVPVLENGNRVWRWMEEFDTSNAVHASWPDRAFAVIVDEFLSQTSNRGALVGDAESFLFSARGVHEYAMRRMKAFASGNS